MDLLKSKAVLHHFFLGTIVLLLILQTYSFGDIGSCKRPICKTVYTICRAQELAQKAIKIAVPDSLILNQFTHQALAGIKTLDGKQKGMDAIKAHPGTWRIVSESSKSDNSENNADDAINQIQRSNFKFVLKPNDPRLAGSINMESNNKNVCDQNYEKCIRLCK